MKATQYRGIDLLRFILANFVVVLHCVPLSAYGSYSSLYLSNGLARIAVPLFFCISGYFFFIKVDFDTLPLSQLWKYLKRNLGLYVVWTIIYIPLIIQNFTTEKYEGMSILFKIAIFIRRFLFIGSWMPLWFFVGACTAVTLVYILLKLKMKPRTILIMSLIIYVFVGCLSDAYVVFGRVLLKYVPGLDTVSRIYMFVFGDTKNGFIFGFFFVALGMFLAISQKEYTNQKKNLLFFILFLILLLIEVTLVSKIGPRDYNMMISLIPCTYFGFLFFLNLQLKECKIYAVLRKMSVLIYGIHGLYLMVQLGDSLTYYLFVIVASILTSSIILYLQRYFEWLKLLF